MQKNRNFMVALPILAIAFFVAAGIVLIPVLRPKEPQPLPEGWRVIRPPHEVSALAIQGEVLWAGGRDGVVAIDREMATVISTLECDVPLTYVQDLLVDNENVLWIGHPEGLSRYDGEECETLQEDDGLPDRRVNTLYQDSSQHLWIGTWGGAVQVGDQGWQVYTTADGLADNMVNVILEDSQGDLWFGSYVAPRGGISICRGGEVEPGACSTFSTSNGLPHNNITDIIEDRQGNVWAGMGLLDRGGAVRFNRSEEGWVIAQTLTQADGLAGKKVRSIFEDQDGVLWFGSEYDGVARLVNDAWEVFTTEDGLSSMEIKVMLQDAEGNLWMGTLDGITRIANGGK
ncbi:MAG: hypothetical protein JW726_09255 [Anaerolineales bacterium]|nr:hypothetical protein [Anaerolineales bacterium]